MVEKKEVGPKPRMNKKVNMTMKGTVKQHKSNLN